MNALVEPARAPAVINENLASATNFRPLVALTAGLGRIAVGIGLCYYHLTSILVVGWTFRLMRRRILRGFWKVSPARLEIPFETFERRWADLDVPTRVVPRWFAVERIAERIGRPKRDGRTLSVARRIARIPSAFLGGLWTNAKTGITALVCTYVLIGPACLIWLGSWYDGWNNSFNKGYEQAFVGPMTGFLAIALFIAAMTHVPLAWAHLAATGDARAFFAFGFIRRLARSRPEGVALYALYFSLLTLPITAAYVAPSFFGNSFFSFLAVASFDEIVKFTHRYNLFTGGIAFVCFVLSHLAAGRLYRKTLLALLARDPALAADLHPQLVRVLGDLALLPDGPPRLRHPLVRAVFGTWRWTRNFILGFALILLWFTVAAQIYVSAFLNYRHGIWLNQPAIHLPSLSFEPTKE